MIKFHPTRGRLALCIALALIVIFAIVACTQQPLGQNSDKTTGCTEACTQEDDTITVECIFQPGPKGERDTTVSVDWSVGGAVQHSESRPLSQTFGVYHAWYHGWRASGYPRISITCDETKHYGLSCSIKWYEPGKGLTTVDFVNRGEAAPAGNVTCDSDHFLNDRHNKGD